MNERLPHTVVLDTHVWIWLQFGDSRIRDSKALEAIEAARSRGGVVISAISLWEVSMLDAKSRILLRQDCAQWIRNGLSSPGVILQPLSPEIAVDSTRLPEGFHSDAADRILVATARYLNAPLVTADSAILAYGAKKHLRTVPV